MNIFVLFFKSVEKMDVIFIYISKIILYQQHFQSVRAFIRGEILSTNTARQYKF